MNDELIIDIPTDRGYGTVRETYRELCSLPAGKAKLFRDVTSSQYQNLSMLASRNGKRVRRKKQPDGSTAFWLIDKAAQ